MRRHLKSGLLAAALVAGSLTPALAALSDADREFIDQVAMAGHEEVSSGESAAKSDNTAVADFGRQMVTEHGQMNKELELLAQQLGYEPPANASLTQQAKTAVTGLLPGATFDKQYVSQQLSDHKATLALLQNYASSGDNAELKAFAQKGIPVVEKHITELEALQNQMQ